MRIITAEQAAQKEYDVIIVGAGITGAVAAKRLAAAKVSCLVVEGGTVGGSTYGGYLEYVKTYHEAIAKIPNSPYPHNPNIPDPNVLEPKPIPNGWVRQDGHFAQAGPLPYLSSHTNYLGGTTLHWLGTTLRMLPEDFAMKTNHGIGDDWPINYEQLEQWYTEAELEIGVSANVEDQAYGGVHFQENYVYPMHEIPASYSDNLIAGHVDGMKVVMGEDETVELKVRNTPAGRNSTPNAAYNKHKKNKEKVNGQEQEAIPLGYTPVGAVRNTTVGRRCMGNSSCVPICPVQAKYSALKSLNATDYRYCEIVGQSVATTLDINEDSGRVEALNVKHYHSTESNEYTAYKFKAKRYILAAHAVNNAMILLASDACTSSGMVGRNLMDHPVLLAWGLSDACEPLWPLRGPLSTSGIEDLRGGRFRSAHASFRMEMGNDGWLWPANAPVNNVTNAVEGLSIDVDGKSNEHDTQYFGRELRHKMRDEISRQFRFGVLVEQLPSANNRVSIDPNYKDQLGNFRPYIEYDLADYTRNGFAKAKQVVKDVFEKAKIKNYSYYGDKSNSGYFKHGDDDYIFNGAGHFAGTHRMGDSPSNSVVNQQQRAWDHDNLYLVGCGNMVTMGTSNPTLTATALTCWAVDNVLQDLGVKNSNETDNH